MHQIVVAVLDHAAFDDLHWLISSSGEVRGPRQIGEDWSVLGSEGLKL